MRLLSFNPTTGELIPFVGSLVDLDGNTHIKWRDNTRLIKVGDYNLQGNSAAVEGGHVFNGGHIYVKGRNHLVLSNDIGSRQDILFIATQTLLPTNFKGMYPLAAYKGAQGEFIGGRIYCDSVEFYKESEIPRLQFIGYTIVYSNEYAVVYHMPIDQEEMMVWRIFNGVGKTQISRFSNVNVS